MQEHYRRSIAVDLELDSAERCAAHRRASRNSFSSTPIPEISIRATSPGTRYLGGLKPIPTPAGVPVAMTSPGISVTPAEIVSMIVGTSKIRSRVLALCRSSPLIQQWICGVLQVDFVARHGPGAHRAERVLRLADQPLAVETLQVARGHVVDDRVAPDVSERVAPP